MIRLAIVVEGPTERQFVNNLLADYLQDRGVFPTAILVGGNGGDVTIGRLSSDMVRLYHSFDFVSSLVDFYGFRNRGNATVGELEERINQTVRHRIARNWDESRVFPYVQLHEFEGLLFSDVNAFATLPGVAGDTIAVLAAIREQFQSPEDVNDSQPTAPSKRIADAIPDYSKVNSGLLVASAIGLPTIRAQCPRFNAWLARLESLAG